MRYPFSLAAPFLAAACTRRTTIASGRTHSSSQLSTYAWRGVTQPLPPTPAPAGNVWVAAREGARFA
eukprot:9083-Eustigmatos_ZCMA.PRE.1